MALNFCHDYAHSRNFGSMVRNVNDPLECVAFMVPATMFIACNEHCSQHAYMVSIVHILC